MITHRHWPRQQNKGKPNILFTTLYEVHRPEWYRFCLLFVVAVVVVRFVVVVVTVNG